MKKWILGITASVSFLIFLVMTIVSQCMIGDLTEQQVADRWSKSGGVAQISCFFSAKSEITEDMLQEFEHSIDDHLRESSIEPMADHPGARLWADAYSAEGKISLSSDVGKVDAEAIGIGGDFFLFHPQEVLYGAYFSGNDLNQDYCVIDEDAAWQLFGSNNVAGMTVYVSGVPHIVTGVIRRPEGRLAKAAGLNSTRVYVSMDTLTKYGENRGISSYEVVMPNPVRLFAYKYVKEKLAGDEQETEILENSSRFSLLNRLKRIREFGTRSMNGKAIIYPYWENIARGYEDIIGLITVCQIFFGLYPAALAVIFLRRLQKRKGWTIKRLWIKIKDSLEMVRDRHYARRYKKQEEQHEKVEKSSKSGIGSRVIGKLVRMQGKAGGKQWLWRKKR